MKIVVIGGTGFIGRRVVARLAELGHEAVAASPSLGVDTVTGAGLAAALERASVVVDVSNAPSLGRASALEFFGTSTRNLLAAEVEAGVGHHVALSIVGTDVLAHGGDPERTIAGYFGAKRVQEELIGASTIPYSIVRATQFYEFIETIARYTTVDDAVHLAPYAFQPMAADDVTGALCTIAVGSPVNGIVNIAGPEQFRLDTLIRRILEARGDPRPVVTDPAAGYFGAIVDERTLVPGAGARLGALRLDDWLARTSAATGATSA